MTLEDKAEIVINQLRADRDRLQNIVNNHIEELEKIKAEFEDKILLNQTVAVQIIDKHISELKGENK